MKKRGSQSRETAAMLAIQALGFIAEEPERRNAFLSVTGIGLGAIRDAARESGFLAGVLEHMLGDESLLIAFAASAGIDPVAVGRARGVLGGTSDRTWERDVP